MDKSFHMNNRQKLAALLPDNAAAVIFSGNEIHKSADAYLLFYADRNFVYLTGIEQKKSILLLHKDASGTVSERLYLLPKDRMAERWTGRRLDREEAQTLSGVETVRSTEDFASDFEALDYSTLWLDFFKNAPTDLDRPGHLFAKAQAGKAVRDVNPLIRQLRLIKAPCEIEALRKAEEMTKAGILAMMRTSKPGMYEYQYKAEFDRALGQFGPKEAGFQSIISAGANNFCIHYDAYTGQAREGDMILNDVGAQWDNMITDVSRGWPCSGKFTDKQKLLYECALKTSDYLFSIIRPGMAMEDVDKTIRSYCGQLLMEAGVMETMEEVTTYMWHGGSHHIGYDVHDAVIRPEILAPGMVFCVDVGIYHEGWGIGFRVEDNCLVTEDGCENLSAGIPRTIEEIEAVMNGCAGN